MTPTALQDALFDIARNIREGGEEVRPIAFLVPSSGSLVLVYLAEIPKDQWRATILEGVAATRARAVIVHTEAWAVTGRQAPVAVASKMAGLGSLEDFPGRCEILHSTLETASGIFRSLLAEISPEGKLGPTEEAPTDGQIGEMVGFFRRG